MEIFNKICGKKHNFKSRIGKHAAKSLSTRLLNILQSSVEIYRYYIRYRLVFLFVEHNRNLIENHTATL